MKKKKIALVGLGYVGLPLAVAYAENGYKVIGYDESATKIEAYCSGADPTGELSQDGLLTMKTIHFTHNEKDLSEADYIIVAVPTPVGTAHVPDLKPLENASSTVGRNMKCGAVVIYESTVYPGVTEDICVPILEKESGMAMGSEFRVGYSPERINPGDKTNTLQKITKIVSGNDPECVEEVAQLYESIISAGVYRAPSIKVAEAAKVIENAQRDVNIAFMNELSIMFHMMKIDTQEVLKAAGTKWNFLNFKPGLVGGHCISVDPYYLTYRSEELGYISQLILSARRINNMMGNYIAHETVKEMLRAGIDVAKSQVLIMGITFKENCPDLRNSKVFDIIDELISYGVTVRLIDPIADPIAVRNEYNLELECEAAVVSKVDTVLIAVAHDRYKSIEKDELLKFYRGTSRVLIDVKGIINDAEGAFRYWRL